MYQFILLILKVKHYSESGRVMNWVLMKSESRRLFFCSFSCARICGDLLTCIITVLLVHDKTCRKPALARHQCNGHQRKRCAWSEKGKRGGSPVLGVSEFNNGRRSLVSFLRSLPTRGSSTQLRDVLLFYPSVLLTPTFPAEIH